MRVQTIFTEDNKERYILINKDGDVVLPVAKFLKYKDNTGSAKNTLRRYCYDLKLYYEFLNQEEKDYEEITIDLMAKFISWLQNPYKSNKILSLNNHDQKTRDPHTINSIINSILHFYDYIMIHENYSIQISEKFKKEINGNKSQFKNFLYHISKEKSMKVNNLKLKVPKKSKKVLNKEQVEQLIKSCVNIRDQFLLYLLYETGLRIGEALSLQLCDIVPGIKKIHVRDRRDNENGAEIKTTNSVRSIDCSQKLIDLYSEYIIMCHTEEVDTDYVFIKLNGDDKYQPMTYTTVEGLFKTLKKKTGIHVTPHMFRHTSLTELWKTGEMRVETLKERAGHKNVQTTINTYIKIDEEDVRKDWEKALNKRNFGGEKIE